MWSPQITHHAGTDYGLQVEHAHAALVLPLLAVHEVAVHLGGVKASPVWGSPFSALGSQHSARGTRLMALGSWHSLANPLVREAA